MKNTLEKLLAGANPAAKESGTENPDALLKTLCCGGGWFREIDLVMPKIVATGVPTIEVMVRQWGSLMPLIGILYRIRSDYGYPIYQQLGLTPEEEAETDRALGRLRVALNSYTKEGRNSSTKMLYDQVIAGRF